MSGPLNYTTTIAADKTANECVTILGRAGASSIALNYVNKRPVGIAFELETPAGSRVFKMPVNVTGIATRLQQAYKRGDIQRRFAEPEQAERVAWRVIKDWLEAQLAIIDAEMVSLDEVMLPYLQLSPGQTVYQAFVERNQLALTAGGES